MKITICGSIAFLDEMQEAQKILEELGHEVQIPPLEVLDENGKAMPAKEYYALRKSTNNNNSWIWDRKEKAMKLHFNKVIWSDAVLILNHTKNNVDYYIGANTLLEMGLAFHHGKKIYLLNPIPEVSYKEEILGMKPIVINENFDLIN